MPRKKVSRSHAEKAKSSLLRGTAHGSPHGAISKGARTDDEWAAMLDGALTAYFSNNGKQARSKVTKRHPVKKNK